MSATQDDFMLPAPSSLSVEIIQQMCESLGGTGYGDAADKLRALALHGLGRTVAPLEIERVTLGSKFIDGESVPHFFVKLADGRVLEHPEQRGRHVGVWWLKRVVDIFFGATRGDPSPKPKPPTLADCLDDIREAKTSKYAPGGVRT